jgi:septum site-determining protein MinD
MGAQVITITSGKGGVGKTTTTANLGMALARLNKKVVVLDADIGLRNLDVVMGLENRIVYDLVDVIEGRCKLRQAMIKHKLLDHLYLIPAAQTRDKSAISPADMIQITAKLRQEFDFILIDSPAGIERGFRNAVAPADEVVIVTNPEVSAVRDADRIIGLIEAVNKGPAQLILNRVKIDMIRRGEMLSADDVTDILAIRLLGIVPEDEYVIPASNSGIPVILNDNSRAGIAFNNIARRLNGETVPFMQLENSGNFFQRLARLFAGSSTGK